MQWKLIPKVAAIMPAILLVGALVAYRAGAFSPTPPAPPPPEPEPQPVAAAPSEPQVMQLDEKTMHFMLGSKSAMPVQPSQLGNTQLTPAPNSPTPQPKPNPVFLGGSKFRPVIGPDEVSKPATPVPPMPVPPKP
jgi:hypothetical protein